jgi:cytochrome b561
MTDLPASEDLAAHHRHSVSAWRRSAVAALHGIFYVGVVLALFGGIAIDRLPDSAWARLGMVAIGVVLVVLAALWLDRREGRHPENKAFGAGD